MCCEHFNGKKIKTKRKKISAVVGESDPNERKSHRPTRLSVTRLMKPSSVRGALEVRRRVYCATRTRNRQNFFFFRLKIVR